MTLEMLAIGLGTLCAIGMVFGLVGLLGLRFTGWRR